MKKVNKTLAAKTKGDKEPPATPGKFLNKPPKKRVSKQINMRVYEDQHQQLYDLAYRLNCSMSTLVKAFVDKGLEQYRRGKS